MAGDMFGLERVGKLFKLRAGDRSLAGIACESGVGAKPLEVITTSSGPTLASGALRPSGALAAGPGVASGGSEVRQAGQFVH